MRKILVAAVALSMAGWFSLADRQPAEASAAAIQSKIPGAQGLARSDVLSADWVIYVRWYNGCNRQRWCKTRYWNGYKYVYSNCYWGSCYYGGGYRGGGGY